MNKKAPQMPKFRNESEEADWWASPPGRFYVKQKISAGPSEKDLGRGSSLVARLKARRIAEHL